MGIYLSYAPELSIRYAGYETRAFAIRLDWGYDAGKYRSKTPIGKCRGPIARRKTPDLD